MAGWALNGRALCGDLWRGVARHGRCGDVRMGMVRMGTERHAIHNADDGAEGRRTAADV